MKDNLNVLDCFLYTFQMYEERYNKYDRKLLFLAASCFFLSYYLEQKSI